MQHRDVLGLLSAVALILCVWAPTRRARAQDGGTSLDCPTSAGRGPLRLTPSSGAAGVTLDAFIKVEYSQGYFGDPSIGADPASSISVTSSDTGAAVPGQVQVIGDDLIFTPNRLLDADARYEGVAHGIDFDLPFNFRTGSAIDMAPPTMGTILKAGSSQVSHSCEAPDGGYRIDVSFRPATDDGPLGSIEYLLYLSRGKNVGAPKLMARLRNFTADPSATITMAFILTTSDASEPVCMVVRAVDGVGKTDTGDQHICFDPIQGNFFAPMCTITAAGASPRGTGAGGGAGACAIVLGGLVLTRRRRGRRARR